MRTLRWLMTLMILATLSLPFAGCTPAVGRPFPVKEVRHIEIDKTTKAEIRQRFGEPWRTGLENGLRTWTYGEYSMKITRDLVIRFTDQNIVKSYSFSSSVPEDENL